jgi:sporulation protein YqfC
MNFLTEISETAGLPIKETLNGYTYTVVSGRACYIARHDGMVRFSEECIAFRVGRERLSVFGENLTVKDMTRDDATVCGRILSVTVEA